MHANTAEKDERLNHLTLDDILYNYADALNRIWGNLVKIQLIAYDSWEGFANAMWKHLVVETLCWKHGLSPQKLGLTENIYVNGMSGGKTKIKCRLKCNFTDYWDILREKHPISKEEVSDMELEDITAIGVKLSSPASLIFQELADQQQVGDHTRFVAALKRVEDMKFDFAKVKMAEAIEVYIKLSDLTFELSS